MERQSVLTFVIQLIYVLEPSRTGAFASPAVVSCSAMELSAAELVKADREHLIHPLHHPADHKEPIIYVRGRGATVQDIDGREYLDGLSGLWNVNAGHGRADLADAAAAQMKELAYFSGYIGSSNI